VPLADVKQRERELSENIEMAGWTADTLERILASAPIVTIKYIDEYGLPWFESELTTDSGDTEQHSIAIMDDDSWEFADQD
jgi:hypothetical protein